MMKKSRRIVALILSLLMLLPTQGMTALADTDTHAVAEKQIETEETVAEAEETVAETEETVAEAEETAAETEESSTDTADAADTADTTVERIEETLPLEPLEGQPSLGGITAIYWNPGGSLPAELTATPSDATEEKEKATTSNAGNIAAGSDRADGFSPKHPVKSLETALKQADLLAEDHGVDRSDIIIYAMNPMEIPDGRMYVLNAGNIRIASWEGRTYHNDTIFYLNGGQMTLMNAVLEAGGESVDQEAAELVRVDGGALQLGQNVTVDGRIVMDYRKSKEKTDWEKASASNAATASNAEKAEKKDTTASASNWTESGVENGGFDIDGYILSTDENEWELLEDKSQASTWREPIIELIEGFDGVDGGYLLELRSDDNKNNVTLAKTLYADDGTEEEFAGFFRLVDTDASEWLLLPSSERTATVRDTGAEDLKRYYRSAHMTTAADEETVGAAEDETIGTTAVMTVKKLSASKEKGGSTIYWNPGPMFEYNGVEYPAGSDSGVDGTTVNAPVKTLSQAIDKANGGTIVVMRTLNLGDADAGDYLTTTEDDAWLVKAASSVVIPTLKVWEVNAQPIFRVPAGQKLILEEIELEGQTKDGRTVESQAIVVEPGADLTVRSAVTAETGYIQINASETLKDYPVHADSTDAVSVVLFFAGINSNLDYRYTDVVVPTTNLLPDGAGDQDKIDTGLALMDCYRLAKANSIEGNGGTSQFDWVLRPDKVEDDLIEMPQNLELYAEYYYDAIYLDGVRGDDKLLGATCQYPVKTWAKARAIWEEQMGLSMAARVRAVAADPDITAEKLDKRYPYPDKIYICGTVTVEDAQVWELKPYTDHDRTVIKTEITSHRDIPQKEDGSGLIHELPETLVDVKAGGDLTLLNTDFRNNTDLSDSRTVRVSDSGILTLKGTTAMSGKLDAAYHLDAKELTRGTHVQALNGGTVLLHKDWTGSIETRQQGVTADGAGTTVTMNGGTIQKNDVYDATVNTSSQKRGAGVSLTGGAAMTMNGGVISGNKTYQYGGGVYMADKGSSFDMKAGRIENNTISMANVVSTSAFDLATSGIGIYAGTGTVLKVGTESGLVTDAIISGNSNYVSKGTGIYSDGTVTVNKAQISDNRADTGGGQILSSYSQRSYGVGIFVDSSGSLIMNGAKVSGNKVQNDSYKYESGFGAGIYLGSKAGNHTIQNSEISGNMIGFSAYLDAYYGGDYSKGGGVYYTAGSAGGGTLEISNTVISENRAYSGAGIQIEKASAVKVNITNCTIEKNTATVSKTAGTAAVAGYGGGIFVGSQNTEVTIKDSTISENRAINGGGVYASYGTLRLLGSSIDKAKVTKNTGSGIYQYASGMIYGENVLISENTSSGLVMSRGAGQVVLRKSNIRNNMRVGVNIDQSTAYFEDVKVEDNGSAAFVGGGIAQSGGNLYWSERTEGGSTLKGNHASYGGGIYQSSGRAILDFSSDVKNSAETAGSNLYMTGGTLYLPQGSWKQPDTPKDGVYNMYLHLTSGASSLYLDPTKTVIEKKAGTNPDAVYLNTANSQLWYLQAPATGDAGVMPIDTNVDIFKVGSVVVRPADTPGIKIYRPNDTLTGIESYEINYKTLKDASVNITYEAGGKLPRRTQLGSFQSESNKDLTNVVLVGEGVYLAGPESGGSDTNDGTSPEKAVATFDRAKTVLKEQINAKWAAEKGLPETDRQGFSPYIYICGNVPITTNEIWELDYGDTLFVDTNAAFEKSEKAMEPEVNPDTLTPQVRRFASFLKQPMITLETGKSLRMEKIIVDGMSAAVNTDIQSGSSPVIEIPVSATATLTGEAQIRNNYHTGIKLLGTLYMEGTETQPNKQVLNIEGIGVNMVGAGAAIEMTGYSRIVSDAKNGTLSQSRTGIEGDAANAHIVLKDHSSIQGKATVKFNYGIYLGNIASNRKIELQDFARISYAYIGIACYGSGNEIHMNHDDSGAKNTDSAQIEGGTRGILAGGSDVVIFMGKKSRITQNASEGIYVSEYNTGTFTLEMYDDSAITQNSIGIQMYRADTSTIMMTDRASITKNEGYGIYESYDMSVVNILLKKDARISGNKIDGIYFTGQYGTSRSGTSYNITLMDQAQIGGSRAYESGVEDCGNYGYGISTRSRPVKVLLQDSASIQYNRLGGFSHNRENDSRYNEIKGTAELTLEGKSSIANNGGYGISDSMNESSETYPTSLNVVLKDNSTVYGNGTGATRQIGIGLTSLLHLEGNSRVSASSSEKEAVFAGGKVYMDGTVKVDGRIMLRTSTLPITLQTAVPAANQYHLYLAEGFLGKEVVIPDGTNVADAAVYLTNYIKDGADGLASVKSLVADRPNIVLEGENNVYLSGGISGKDTNDGNSPSTPVRTFHKARELLRTGRFTKGANIYITDTVALTNWSDTSGSGFDGDWSFDSDGTVTNEKTGAVWTPIVMRYKDNKNSMVSLSGGQTAIFKNITLDGNKETVSSYSSVITGGYNTTVVLGDGAILQNNKISGKFVSPGVSLEGSTLNLEGGIIQGMELILSAGEGRGVGAAIHCKDYNSSWPGVVNFKSGQIRNNTLEGSTNSHGAAVYVGKGGTLIMSGGTISGNTNRNSGNSGVVPSYYYQNVRGAGVYVMEGYAEISGGSIRDNTSNVGSGIYYADTVTTRSETRGVILSGGQITNNHVNSYASASATGIYSPVYVNGPNFQLKGGGCDISDTIYLNDIRNHIIVSGDIYQAGRQYKVSLNQGRDTNQFHKGSVVVAPDGDNRNDVTGYLPYFTVISNPYVLDRGQIEREIATGGKIMESQSLLLMQAVYLDGEHGNDTSSGNTPKTAVKTFTQAKSIGETGIGAGIGEKDYYIIYISGKATNTAAESTWSMSTPAYMCRYTGFTVYKENGEPVDEINRAYYGHLIEPQHDLTIGRIAVYGRRSIDSLENNGDSLIMIPANVTVTVQPEGGEEAVFGRNYNVGQYFAADGLQANLSSMGGAFQVSPEAALNMSAGRIVETEATFGKAIYLGADVKDGTKTGHLTLSKSPEISGSVYLDGVGGTSSAYVEPQTDYVPSGKLSIAVKNDYNGREVVRYPAGVTPGGDEMEYYSFEDSIYALYDVVYRAGAANVIELNQKTALYLDGVHGKDSNDGSTPTNAFRTLKHLYEYIAAQQASGAIISKGVAVYIVDTVTLDSTTDQDVMLNNVQKKDTVTGEKYYEGYYQDAATPQIQVDGQVYFKRYAQPKEFNASDSYFDGYDHGTMVNELFNVANGGKLTLWGIYLDGHSLAAASNNKLYAADGVEAMAPLVVVKDGGYLDCQFAAASSNNIATSSLFLNNFNGNKKTNVIGTLNGSDIYEGSSAGIELQEGGIGVLNHAEFRNLYLGDNVVSGGTDVYHNGKELHFYNQTLFTGTVFLEGQGVAGREDTYDTSRFLYVDEYGTPAQNDFQVLMRDPYKHRVVVNYVPQGAGPVSSQIGAYRLEERVKEFFYLTKKADEPWILELLVPSAVYIAKGGDDNWDNPAAGSNPAHPVGSLKRAYELLKTRAGNTISIVGTVEIDQNTSITGTQYVGTDGTVNLGSTDKVHFVRYIKPDFARDGSMTEDELEKLGYNVDDFTGVLLNITAGNKLTVGNNVYFDGHSEKKDNKDLPKEVVVTRETTSMAPLMTVQKTATVELLAGSTLQDNNNVYDADAGDTGTEGGAIHNSGTVTVTGATFDNNHAKKGDAAYQAGDFTIQSGAANLEGHSFYLGSTNSGTDAKPDWEDHVLRIAEKLPDSQTFDMDMDHPAAGRDVIVFTNTTAYAPAAGADAEHRHFLLGSTVPADLFLVEAEDDPAVLELQDWKTLHVEVPANIYLAVTRKGTVEGSTKLNGVITGSTDLFSTPEYQIVNKGDYDVLVSIDGMDNVNAEAGITVDGMKLKTDTADVIGEKDIYLALKGTDTSAADGFTAAETPLTDGTAAPFELGQLKAGSTGSFEMIGKVGVGFVDKYKDLAFPLTDTVEEVQNYMDGSGKDALVHARAKYLLKYKVEMTAPRR